MIRELIEKLNEEDFDFEDIDSGEPSMRPARRNTGADHHNSFRRVDAGWERFRYEVGKFWNELKPMLLDDGPDYTYAPLEQEKRTLVDLGYIDTKVTRSSIERLKQGLPFILEGDLDKMFEEANVLLSLATKLKQEKEEYYNLASDFIENYFTILNSVGAYQGHGKAKRAIQKKTYAEEDKHIEMCDAIEQTIKKYKENG